MIHLLFVALCLFLHSCGKDSPSNLKLTSNTTEISGNIMTIDYKIVIGMKLPQAEKLRAEKIIADTFHEIHTVFNKWNPDSELSKLNRLPKDLKVSISPSMQEFLGQTGQIVMLTGGLFDPTIEPLQKLWKSNLENGTVPTDEEIQALSPALGWDKIHFKEGFFFKDDDRTSLDFGGIAKGYCVDLIVDRLNEAGYKDLLVEWGGEIRASGVHPDNRPWKIFISRLGDPNPETAIAQIDLRDMAIATSGDYLQNWTLRRPEGIRIFFHIINPRTKRPLEANYTSIANASVLAPNCAVADGIATALMMFTTLAEAEDWLKSKQEVIPSLAGWIVSRQALNHRDGETNDQNDHP